MKSLQNIRQGFSLHFLYLVAHDIICCAIELDCRGKWLCSSGVILGACNRRFFVLLVSLMTASQFFVLLSFASEVYQWTDEKGATLYSDSPPPGANPKLKKLRIDRIQRPESKDYTENAVKDVAQKKRLGDITVILYFTDW